LADRAALFVDGRYTVQANAQVDGKIFRSNISSSTHPSNGSSKI
jgi:hypothetical protein